MTAMVIRPGQRLWAGRRRHGNADTHGSPTSPAVPARTISQMLREAPRGTRCVGRQAEEVTRISDQHVARPYRRQARRSCVPIVGGFAYDHDSGCCDVPPRCWRCWGCLSRPSGKPARPTGMPIWSGSTDANACW